MNPLVRRIRETIISPEEANSRIFPNFVVMKTTRLILISLLPLLLLLALSCQSNGIRQELLAVETYLNAEPERALRVLDSMDDGTTLRSRRDRAHYALLKSMALDKNYIDLTSDSLIAPAVAYYSRHGTADEKMKAYYYQGRVYQNAKNYDAAFLSFSKSEECMDQSTDDRQKGIIYIAQSYLYGIRYHYDQQKKYIDLAKIAYARAGDYERVQLCQVEEALYYQTTLDWNRADSVYQSILRTEFDERRMLTVYSHYARMLVLQPIQEPAQAREIFEKHCGVLDAGVSATKIGVYAYALVLLGEDDLANQQIARYKDSLMRIRGNDLDYWLYLIEKHRGNLSSALASLEWDYGNQTEQVRKILSESMSSIVSEYHSQQQHHQLKLKERQQYVFLLLFLMLLVVSVAIYRHLLHRKRIQQESYENMLSTLRYANSRMESSQNELEDKFVDLYREKFKVVNDLYFLYSRSGLETSLHHELMMQKITELFSGIEEEGRLATILDQDLDNLIRDMRSEVDLTDQEVLLICFFVIKLDTRIISCITNLSTASIYTRKSRIIKKIESLSSSSKSKYLRYLR